MSKQSKPTEVVIVNTEDGAWIDKLLYTLGKAGFVSTEDYKLGSDRILVFNRKEK